MFAIDGILIGAGDLRYMARTMVAAAILFAVLAGVVVISGLGMGWLWAALSVFMLARAIALWRRWRGSDWLVIGV